MNEWMNKLINKVWSIICISELYITTICSSKFWTNIVKSCEVSGAPSWSAILLCIICLLYFMYCMNKMLRFCVHCLSVSLFVRCFAAIFELILLHTVTKFWKLENWKWTQSRTTRINRTTRTINGVRMAAWGDLVLSFADSVPLELRM
jgi:hypothetical protein